MISDFSCIVCHCNKSHKLSFSTSTLISNQPLQIIFFDACISPIISHDDLTYYDIFFYHFIGYIWSYPLKQKSNIKEVSIRFTTIVEKYFIQNINTLYSDNGGEYVALANFLALNGISHLTTPPHTPPMISLSDVISTVKTGLALLSYAFIPLTYWFNTFAIIGYLINCMSTLILQLFSSYEKIFGVPPNYSKLKVFGYLCYHWLHSYTSHKHDSCSKLCIFLRYSLTQSDYFCYNPSSTKIHHHWVNFSFCNLTYSSSSSKVYHCFYLDSTIIKLNNSLTPFLPPSEVGPPHQL